MREVEPYWGDICGEPLPPMRPLARPQYAPPRWIERGVRAVVTAFSFTVGAALLVAAALSFLYAKSHCC